MKSGSIFIICLVYILFALTAFAGEDKKEEKRNKFAVGAFFSPAYDFRYISFPDDSQKITQSLKEMLKEYDRGKFGYTAGVNFSWFVSKRYTIETGLWFSNKGFSMKWTDFMFAEPDQLPLEKGKIYYIYGVLNLPLKLNINIITKPVKVFVSAGVTADASLYSKYKFILVYTDGGKKTTYTNMNYQGRDLNLSGLASAGIEYAFLRHFSLRFEPVFMMNFLPVYQSEVKEYLWSVGGNFGIFYLFT